MNDLDPRTSDPSRIHRDDLAACVDELLDGEQLLTRVRLLFHETGVPGATEHRFGHFKISASPAPWNDAAAGLYHEIHDGSRNIEAGLRMLLGYTRRSRGGSDAETVDVLDALPDLIATALAQHPDHEPVITHGRRRTVSPRRAARDVTSWPRRCRALLDQARPTEEPWQKAPGGLRCPYCDRPLRLAPGWDTEGAPPIWCRHCPKAPPTGDGSPHVEFDFHTWMLTLSAVPAATASNLRLVTKPTDDETHRRA